MINPEEQQLSKTLNILCREQMKYKLLRGIRVDQEVCKLEGRDMI